MGRIGADAARRGTAPGRAPTLRKMHGMLSVTILICVFTVVVLACVYVAGRVLVAGRRRGNAS